MYVAKSFVESTSFENSSLSHSKKATSQRTLFLPAQKILLRPSSRTDNLTHLFLISSSNAVWNSLGTYFSKRRINLTIFAGFLSFLRLKNSCIFSGFVSLVIAKIFCSFVPFFCPSENISSNNHSKNFLSTSVKLSLCTIEKSIFNNLFSLNLSSIFFIYSSIHSGVIKGKSQVRNTVGVFDRVLISFNCSISGFQLFIDFSDNFLDFLSHKRTFSQ